MSKAELIVLAALVLAVVAGARAAWRTPVARAIWLFLAMLTVSMTVRLDAVAAAIDAGSGVPAFAVLIKHLTGIVAVAFLVDAVAHGSRDNVRPLGRRHVPLAAAGLALVLLFPHIPRASSADFTDAAAGHLAATLYEIVWLASLGAAMAAVAWLFYRAIPVTADRLLRTGFRVLLAGLALGAVYAVLRIGYFTARLWLQRPSDELMGEVTDAVKYAGIALITAGFGIAALARHRQYLRVRRHLRATEPMWCSLVRPQHSLDRAGLSTTELVLRRAAELRDALILLRPYTSQTVRAHAIRLLHLNGVPDPSPYQADVIAWRHALARRDRVRVPSGDPISLPVFTQRPDEQDWQRLHASAWADPDVEQVLIQLAETPNSSAAILARQRFSEQAEISSPIA